MTIQFTIPGHFEVNFRRAIILLMARELSINSVDGIDDWLLKISSLSYDENFLTESNRIAIALVKSVNILNALKWRELVRKTSIGSKLIPKLYDFSSLNVKETLLYEVNTIAVSISTFPERLSKTLGDTVSKLRANGVSELQITNSIKKKFASLLVQRAKLLVQSDLHRVNSNITRVRSNDFRLPCFIWSTSKDEVVRPAHFRMENVLVFWNHLPSPELLIHIPAFFGRYVPGGCPNCRCSAVPVVSIDDLFTTVLSRIKVYYNDEIRLMTRLQLLKVISQESYAEIT